jgi:type VI secretion system FHA domain protein
VAGGDSRVGTVSLLNGPPDEGPQRTITHARRPDDWSMQTRPFERNKATLAPLATPVVPAEQNHKRRADGANELQAGVEAFCRGAGIDPAALPMDAQATLLTLAGQMVREMVLGLMEALKGRADVKGRFHISQTTIQPTDNNPLKFSASVDDALRKLLDAHSSRYLGPVDAFRDAFGDLKTHQLAMGGAMQSALDELLQRLNPQELQERFDRGLKRGALLGATNKMKYWDLYGEFYGVLNQRDTQGLPPVFSEAFTKNYAEKVSGFHGQKKK